jgi:hypothetical protein
MLMGSGVAVSEVGARIYAGDRRGKGAKGTVRVMMVLRLQKTGGRLEVGGLNESEVKRAGVGVQWRRGSGVGEAEKYCSVLSHEPRFIAELLRGRPLINALDTSCICHRVPRNRPTVSPLNWSS